MHANNFVVDNSCARQAVEGITELLPHFHREPTAAFIVKAINAIDPCALVVPP